MVPFVACAMKQSGEGLDPNVVVRASGVDHREWSRKKEDMSVCVCLVLTRMPVHRSPVLPPNTPHIVVDDVVVVFD